MPGSGSSRLFLKASGYTDCGDLTNRRPSKPRLSIANQQYLIGKKDDAARPHPSMIRRQDADPLQQSPDGVLLLLLGLPMGIAVDRAPGRRRCRLVFARRRRGGAFCVRWRIDGHCRHGRDRRVRRLGRVWPRSAVGKGACGLRASRRCFRRRCGQTRCCRRGRLLAAVIGQSCLGPDRRRPVVRRQHRIEGSAKGQRRQQQHAGADAKLCPVGLPGRTGPHRSSGPGW
jgi:hypothetical protein